MEQTSFEILLCMDVAQSYIANVEDIFSENYSVQHLYSLESVFTLATNSTLPDG
jgi:hypothetical protein